MVCFFPPNPQRVYKWNITESQPLSLALQEKGAKNSGVLFWERLLGWVCEGDGFKIRQEQTMGRVSQQWSQLVKNPESEG